jgi:hypothetical protein
MAHEGMGNAPGKRIRMVPFEMESNAIDPRECPDP